jgi:hypothetical protein
MLDEELAKLREAARNVGRYDDAADLFRQPVEAPSFPEFLTLPAYDLITADTAQAQNSISSSSSSSGSSIAAERHATTSGRAMIRSQ